MLANAKQAKGQKPNFVLDIAKTGLDIIDSDFNIRFASPNCVKTLGGNYYGKKCYEYFMNRQSPCEACALKEALATQKTVEKEMAFNNMPGKVFRVTAIPFQYNSDEWLVAEISVDVTDFHRARESFRHNQMQYKKIIDLASEGILVLDENFYVTFVNLKMAQMLGYSVVDMLGQHLFSFLDEEVIKLCEEESQKRGLDMQKEFDTWFIHKEGHKVYVVLGINSLFDDNNKHIGYVGVVMDVTQRRKIEEQLRESEKRYREIFEHATEGIFQSTVEGKLKVVNPALAKIFGYSSPNEMMANIKNMAQQLYVYSEEREKFKELLRKYGRVKNFQAQFYCKNRNKIWLSVNGKVVKDDKGNISYYEGVIEDITEIKILEEKNKQQEKRYQRIVDSVQEGILAIDENDDIAFANPQMADMLGFSVLEMLGQNLSNFMERSWDEFYQEFIKNNKKSIKERYYFEFIGKDKKVLFANISISPILEEGVYKGEIIFISDITRQRQMMNTLLETEKKYREIFENMQEGVYRTTPAGRYDKINPAFANIFGFDSPEQMKMEVMDITNLYVNPQDRARIKEILETKGVVKDFEAQLKRKDGRIIWLSISGKAIKNESGQVIFYEGTVQDITERKQYERALKLQINRFEALYDLALNMSIGKTPEDNLLFIIEESRRLLNCDAGYIALMDTKYKELRLHTFSGIKTEAFKNMILPLGKGLGGLVMDTRKGYIVSDYFKDGNIEHIVDDIVKNEGLYSGMAVPLIAGKNTLGVLALFNRNKTEFKQDDLDTLFLFGNLGAVEIMRKRFKEELVASEEKFSKAFFCSADIICITSLYDGRCIDVNEKALEIFGYSRLELINKSVFEMNMWKDFEDRKRFVKIIENYGSVRNFEAVLRKKNGEFFYASLSSEKITIGNEGCLISTIRDITERKRVMEDLKLSNEAYEKKNMALKELIEHIEVRKNEIKKQIQVNVDKLLLPTLKKLERKGSNLDKKYIDLLRHNLENLVQSFGIHISEKGFNLSPRELEICNLIKDGLEGKEIAQALNISYASLETHRKNIRRKLKIQNKDINLAVYLRNL